MVGIGGFRRLWFLQGQIKAADWASIIRFEPGLEAIGVVDVTAWHEHALHLHLNAITADRATRRLQFSTFLLAVLFFDFDDWQTFHC